MVEEFSCLGLCAPGSVSLSLQVLIDEPRAVEALNVTSLLGKELELVQEVERDAGYTQLGSPLHTAWALEHSSSTFISQALPVVMGSGLLRTCLLPASSAAKCWSSPRCLSEISGWGLVSHYDFKL